MINRNKSRFFLLKLVFPLIYAIFFVVQLFINFDTALTRFSDRYQIIQYQNLTNHTVALEKGKGSHPIITKFRLNKRFQPAFIATITAIYCAPVITFITIQRAMRANPFKKDHLFDIRLLRGPPFVT